MIKRLFARISLCYALIMILSLGVLSVTEVFAQSSCRLLQRIGSLQDFKAGGLASSEDGSVLFGQEHRSGEISIWDAQTGKLVRTFRDADGEEFSRLSGFMVNRDGKVVAARTRKGKSIWIALTHTGTQVAKFETNSFGNSSVTKLSPDGKVLLTAGFNDGVVLWNASTGRRIATLAHADLEYSPGKHFTFSSADFNSDGSMLAVAFFADIYLWDGGTGEFVKRLFVTASGPQNAKRPAKFSHQNSIYDLKFSPDGKLLASAGRDGVTRLWDVQNGQLRAILDQGDRVLNVKFSPDSRFVASVSYDDRKIKVWDTVNGKLLYDLKGGKSGPFSITFSDPSAGLLAVPIEGRVEFRNIETGKLVETCSERFGYFLEAGKRFIVGTDTGYDLFAIDTEK